MLRLATAGTVRVRRSTQAGRPSHLVCRGRRLLRHATCALCLPPQRLHRVGQPRQPLQLASTLPRRALRRARSRCLRAGCPLLPLRRRQLLAALRQCSLGSRGARAGVLGSGALLRQCVGQRRGRHAALLRVL